jgi:hypothetical protein
MCASNAGLDHVAKPEQYRSQASKLIVQSILS